MRAADDLARDLHGAVRAYKALIPRGGWPSESERQIWDRLDLALTDFLDHLDALESDAVPYQRPVH